MSALGQKQTFAMQNIMSALPPKADMCSARRHVRFVPIADKTQKTPGGDLTKTDQCRSRSSCDFFANTESAQSA